MDTNDQINHVLSKFRSWFEEAVVIIKEVRPGERLPVTVLSDRVAQKFNLKRAQVYPVMRFLFDELNLLGFKRQKGAHGGYVRDLPKDKE